MIGTPQVAVHGGGIQGCGPVEAEQLLRADVESKPGGDLANNFVLHAKDLGLTKPKRISPEGSAIADLQQTDIHPPLARSPLHRALDDQIDLLFAAGGERFDTGAGVPLDGACRADRQFVDPADPGNDFTGHAETEIVVRGIRREDLKGQDRDRTRLLPAPQIVEHLAGILIAMAAVRTYSFDDDAGEVGRDGMTAGIRQTAGEQFMQHHAQAVNIRSPIDR
ncbi:MAG: hypothetical protein IPO77_07995 [Acidobacteria bacterium]|nr:hypothetical protein [Acidobacteriota bacterium]